MSKWGVLKYGPPAGDVVCGDEGVFGFACAGLGRVSYLRRVGDGSVASGDLDV